MKLDNAIRWNSAYEMVNRGLKLQRRIDLFCYKHYKALDLNRLTPDDWDTLKSLAEILKPFKEETMNLQGRGVTGSYGTVWEVLPTIHTLLKHVQEQEKKWLATAVLLDRVR